MAKARPQSNVCKRKGWSEKFVIEGMQPAAVNRRYGRNAQQQQRAHYDCNERPWPW